MVKKFVLDLAELTAPKEVVISGTLGKISAKPLSTDDMMALKRADRKTPFTPETFAQKLVSLLVVTDDNKPLSPEAFSQLPLSESEAIVEGIIRRQSYFFIASDGQTSQDEPEEGQQTAQVSMLRRDDGKSSAAYLLRGWRHYEHRHAEEMSALVKGMGLSSLSEVAKLKLGPSLYANIAASTRISEQLGLMKIGPSATEFREHFLSPPRMEPIKLPPNPIVKTNEILGEMSQHIAEMRELAASTAQMQQSLNDAAQTILVEFSKGAADLKSSGDQALRVAVASAIISAVAFVASAVGIYIQYDQNSSTARDNTVLNQKVVESQSANTNALNQASNTLSALKTSVEKSGMPKNAALRSNEHKRHAKPKSGKPTN